MPCIVPSHKNYSTLNWPLCHLRPVRRNHLQPGALLAASKPLWWNRGRNQGSANRNKPAQLRQAKQHQRLNMQQFRHVPAQMGDICRYIFLYRYVTRVQVALKTTKK